MNMFCFAHKMIIHMFRLQKELQEQNFFSLDHNIDHQNVFDSLLGCTEPRSVLQELLQKSAADGCCLGCAPET